MRLLFGLGNPGREYGWTRHNLGFLVIDNLAFQHKIELSKLCFQAVIGEGMIDQERIVLVKPLTFVNRSGISLVQILNSYGLDPVDIVVISDDINLQPGQLRISRSGSDGGHRGLRSIIESLGTEEFPRLRIGVGMPGGEKELVDYVLSEFREREWKIIEQAIERAIQALGVIVVGGIDKAMREYN